MAQGLRYKQLFSRRTVGYPDPTQSPYYRPPHGFGDTNEYGLPKDMPMEEQIKILNKIYRRTTDVLGERYPRREGTQDFVPVTPDSDPVTLDEQIRIIEGRRDARGTYPKVQDPIEFMDVYLYDLNTVPNSEVMGPKEQVFSRYANPEDGTLNNTECWIVTGKHP